MSRIAYVNGLYRPYAEASVHIDDRGYQFADGIYEVCGIRDGKLMDEALHYARMQRSLSELRIAMPVALTALPHILREVIRRNKIRDGIVYFQITRGVAPRDHAFPPASVPSSLVITAKRLNVVRMQKAVTRGVTIVTMPDIRWARRDIKSISLLPNILAKQAARDAGAYEAWLVDPDGYVTEGSSTNAWIIDGAGRIITRPLANDILSGVTRLVLLDAAMAEGLEIVERPFTVEEALSAREAFISASTAIIMPVISIDGVTIGNGEPGSISLRLRAAYEKVMQLT